MFGAAILNRLFIVSFWTTIFRAASRFVDRFDASLSFWSKFSSANRFCLLGLYLLLLSAYGTRPSIIWVALNFYCCCYSYCWFYLWSAMLSIMIWFLSWSYLKLPGCARLSFNFSNSGSSTKLRLEFDHTWLGLYTLPLKLSGIPAGGPGARSLLSCILI